MYNFFLIAILLLSCTTDSSAQTNQSLISTEDTNLFLYNGSIQYEGKAYKLQDMEDIFKNRPSALQAFRRAENTRNATHILGGMTMGAFILRVYSFSNNPDEDNGILPSERDILRGISKYITPILGVTTLIVRLTYNEKKQKAIRAFNDAEHLGLLYNSNPINLSAGTSQNGIGLTVKF